MDLNLLFWQRIYAIDDSVLFHFIYTHYSHVEPDGGTTSRQEALTDSRTNTIQNDIGQDRCNTQ